MIAHNNIWSICHHATVGLESWMAAALKIASETGYKAERPAMTAGRGYGVVPISGVMVKRGSRITDLGFGTSSLEVGRQVDAFAANDSIGTIVLAIDSPGGSVDGLSELGDAVRAASGKKRVIAQVDGMAASAAYYVASQATEIRAGAMDLVGSIGTRLMLYDFSKMFEAEGVKAIPIDTGEFKSAGAVGTEITEAQQADFQRVVDAYFADFVGRVASGRGMSEGAVREVADGRVFVARDEAVGYGLVDTIATLDQTIAELVGEADGRERRAKARAGATVAGL